MARKLYKQRETRRDGARVCTTGGEVKIGIIQNVMAYEVRTGHPT